MTLRLTTVIMASVKSDKVKQSLDNLENYRLFTEGKLKPFIHKEFDQCGSLLRKIMLEGEMYHLLTQLPLTVEERNNLVIYSRSFLPVWYRAGMICIECLLIFGTYSVDCISWFLHFSWIEHSSKAIKASSPFKIISLFWNFYEKDSINRLNDGQANH